MEKTLSFPLLIPINNTFREYRGYIQVNSKQYPVEIKLKSNGIIGDTSNLFNEDLEIKTTDELSQILSPFITNIKSRINQCKDLNQFFFELKDIIEKIPKQQQQQQQQKQQQQKQLPIEVYTLILQELNEIGWESVTKINESLDEFQIIIRDEMNRNYIISFQIPSQYPKQLPIFNHPLLSMHSKELINIQENEKFSKQLKGTLSSCTSIKKSIDFIKELISFYQEFFKVMEDIDKNSWVIEPENPKPWIKSRRISLQNNISLCFDINPLSPYDFPLDCKFLGQTKNIDPLKKLITSKWNEWDSSRGTNNSVLENFKRILSITFPMKSLFQLDSVHVECGICYSYRDPLDNTAPAVNCTNEKCQKPFHKSCLYEWFKSLPNTTQSFSLITGACPYCTTKLSIEI